jgi:hypothetical protein
LTPRLGEEDAIALGRAQWGGGGGEPHVSARLDAGEQALAFESLLRKVLAPPPPRRSSGAAGASAASDAIWGLQWGRRGGEPDASARLDAGERAQALAFESLLRKVLPPPRGARVEPLGRVRHRTPAGAHSGGGVGESLTRRLGSMRGSARRRLRSCRAFESLLRT